MILAIIAAVATKPTDVPDQTKYFAAIESGGIAAIESGGLHPKVGLGSHE